MTIGQQNYFFLLCKELEYNKQEAINAAERKYGKKFMQLTGDEVGFLIDIFEKEKNAIEEEKHPKQEEFPKTYHIWDYMMKEMIEEVELKDIPVTLGENFDNRYHVLPWTGRVDETKQKIFAFDFVESMTGDIYLIQWSWEDCAWVGYNEKTQLKILLASFGKLWRIGSIYEEVKPIDLDKET